MTLTTLLMLLALSVPQEKSTPGPAGPSGPSQITRAFRLRGLEPTALQQDSLHFPMSPLHADQDIGIWYDAELGEPEYDALVDLLISPFAEEYNNAEAYIEIDQDHLMLHGSPGLIQGSERLIHYWRDEVIRPTTVRILRGKGGELSEAVQLQLNGNAQSEVRRTRQHAVIRGFELNIATRAATASPELRQILIGDVQLATGDPYLDGMHVSWLTRTPELVRVLDRDALIRTQLSTEDSNSLQFSTSPLPDPQLIVRSVATSSALSPNRGMEVETAGSLPGGISWNEVSKMELTGDPPKALHRLGDITGTPAALIAQGILSPNRWKISGRLASVRGGWPDPSDPTEPPYWLTLERNPFDVAEHMTRYTPEESELHCSSIGPFAQVHPSEFTEDPKASLDRALRRWSKDGLLPPSLEVTLQLERSGSESASLKVRAPVSSGSALVASVGSERLAVKGQRSYVAEGSSICAPQVAPIFQGMLIHLEPALLTDGTLLVSLSLEGRFRRGEIRADQDSGIELEDFDVLSVRDRDLRLIRGDDGTWTRRFGNEGEASLSLSLTIRQL